MIKTFDPDPSLYPDPDGRAARVCRFARLMRLFEGKRAGELLELGPFQEAIIRAIYGPSDDEGRRLVRTACIWMPRGQGKTALVSALGLAHLAGPENEAAGQIVVAAADREQAGIAFRNAIEFCRADRVLYSRTQPVESQKRLKHPRTSSEMRAVSSDAATKHGLNISLLVCDEIHAWKATKARELYGTLSDSMVKRESPLTIIISTAGSGEGTLARELWDYSVAVANGEVDDPSFAPIIFAADPDDDWRDEAVWRKANPALAAGFLNIRELRAKAKKAERSPVEEARFRQYHLGQWGAGSVAPWISTTVYDAAKDSGRTDDQLAGQDCYIGLDLSAVADLTAGVALFPLKQADGSWTYDARAHFWLPAEGIEQKSDADRAQYKLWQREGFLTLTPGNVVNYDAMVQWAAAMKKKYRVRKVGIDPWRQVNVERPLRAAGLSVTLHAQNLTALAQPTLEMERLVLTGAFHHGGNPVLRMCFANANAYVDPSENKRLVKGRSTGRIDGAAASIIALAEIMDSRNAPKPGVFVLGAGR